MYQTYADDIFRYLYVHVRDEALAKDLTADTFLKAWKGIDSFDFKQPRPWLYKIAQNVMTDHWRKKRPGVVDDPDTMPDQIDDAPPIEELVDAKMTNERLMDAVARLSQSDRSIVTLRFMHGYSAKEAADALGLTEANVRVKQFRALKQLRRYLS